jgi:hypothetical protein
MMPVRLYSCNACTYIHIHTVGKPTCVLTEPLVPLDAVTML